MRTLLFSLLLITAPYLFTEKRVELVANFPVDTERLTALLHKQGSHLKIIASDLSHFDLKRSRNNQRSWLQRLNLDFTPSLKIKELAKICFYNITSDFYKLDLSRFPKEKLILFMWETPLILPNMYKERVQRLFSKIYTFNDALVDNRTYFKFFYPVLQSMVADRVPFEKKRLCALFSSNFSSKKPESLYEKRKEWIRFFEEKNERGFALFGRGWDAKEHPSYQGYIEDKVALLKQFRFNICYENSDGIPGYITEKIFDAFAAGTIPVYLGAPNIQSYIPKDCFIDPRDFPSMEDLYCHLRAMSQKEYEGYMKRIEVFLKSDEAALFSLDHFIGTLRQAFDEEPLSALQASR